MKLRANSAANVAVMKALLIVNPAAGQGRTRELTSAAWDVLAPFVADTLLTEGAGDAERAARDAVTSGRFDAVLVAGGDGTLNEVVNGLMSASPSGTSALPLGIIPLGTQNVLAHELAIPRGDNAALGSLLSAGKTRTIDLGKIGDRYFSLMAGFGFDGAVVRDVLLPVKELIGPAAYGFAVLRLLTNYQSTIVRLQIDGEEVISDAFLVIVANAASYADRQIKMTPFATVDDGWLDVCVFERAPLDRVGFVTQIMAVLARRHLRDPRVRYYRARSIGIDSTPPIQGQIDGDIYRETPVQIDIVPKALRVFVT